MRRGLLPVLILMSGLLASCDQSTNTADYSQLAPGSAQAGEAATDVWLPDPDENVGGLQAIKVVAQDNVWIAGGTGRNSTISTLTEPSKALVAHWDGKEWSIQARTGDGTHDYVFNDIDVTSQDDIWAVGRWVLDEKARTVYKPLIVHWDGKTWNSVSLPDLGVDLWQLESVAAIAPDDVWIGGSELIHWDGNAWTVVDIPPYSPRLGIGDMAAVSATDIWAVAGSVILHWNGKDWSVAYDTTNLGGYSRQWYPLFQEITATSAGNVWAIAMMTEPTNCGGSYSYVLHWDGNTWGEVGGLGSVVRGCGSGTDFYLESIYASAPNRAWVLGTFRGVTQIVQWDGKEWKYFACPMQESTVVNYPFEHYYFLGDIAEISEGKVWILGSYNMREEPYSTGWTNDWLFRGWIASAYMGKCVAPTATPIPTPPTLPPRPTFAPKTRIPKGPEEISTVPMPLASGVPQPVPSWESP